MWLNQQQMAELFGTDRTSVLRHIHNIYKTHELDEAATCAKIAQVRIEGNRQVRCEVPFYNLDMIISVGYRVNSIRGTQFRQWANKWSTPSHDRWLIIDDSLYHCGHSLKDMGKKLSAITLMGTNPGTILKEVK